ncbi:Fc.00g047680.m01.CDS01 [Cosmosporella sp. VM-42]
MLALSLLSIAALAVASPVGDYAKELEDRAISVTAGDLSNFKFYVQHAAAAYCNANTAAGQPVKCGGSTCPSVEGDKVTVIANFNGASTGIGGYVATDNARSEIVVSVRGSSNIRNWIANLEFAQQDCSFVAGCGVHTGFQKAWAEISAPVKAAVAKAKAANPSFKIISTGHSLGGAVATLAAAYLRKDGNAVDLFTYGSPRVGNNVFANFVTNQAGAEFRVTHGDDPVPRLPPIVFGYRHTTPEYWLDGGSLDVTYNLSEIDVCEGTANVDCNGGTFGLDILAHLRYLQDVSGCAPIGIFWKREEMSDEELEKKVNDYAQADKDFVAGL